MSVKSKTKTEYDETLDQLKKVYEDEGFDLDEEMIYSKKEEDQEVYIDPFFQI
jgi:hypothetical protein